MKQSLGVQIVILASLTFLFIACNESARPQGINSEKVPSNHSQRVKRICSDSSEWKDHNGKDYCSYYSEKVSCSKITGKLNMITRLHKSALEKDVFEGGMSSRWFEITDQTITYFKPSGEIEDKGTCNCKNGVLKIDWFKGGNLPEECRIYFRSKDTVELRYYDYPFDFMSFKYDSLKPKTNPTKILGVIQ